MTDNDIFFRDLWAFVGSCPPVFPKRLVADIYELGKQNDIENGSVGRHYALCWCCRDVANALRSRLPDHIHNRIVLGPQNERTVEYIKRWGEVHGFSEKS